MSDAGGTNGYQKMPPGWDCKYDQTTGNCYYINYLTKAMQLEDPRAGRSSYKQLQNERCSTESIALQPLAQHSHHSSPFHVVHPSNNLTAVRAFQERALHNLSTSPLLSASSRGQLELSSPLPVQRARLPSNMSRRSTIQETSFSDTQAVVTKIQNMFPTADENHIRLLLKRYMKNIFPKADEMLLLDILANADNNVQFASEKLISLGYVKRDMQQPHRPNNRPPQLESEQQAGQEQAVQHIPLRPKEYTAEQKADMESQFKQKYPNIAERIILMALESVNYAEDRATQILQIVQDEDEQRNQKQTLSKSQPAASEMKLKVDQVDATLSSKPHKQHRHLPSINVITPSTATTQIILSHEQTPEQVPNEAAFQSESEPKADTTACQGQTMSASSISGASTHSYASPPQSPTRPNYERLTTKGMLARSSCYNNNNSNGNNNNNNNNYSISSYASYSTSMGSSSVSASSIVKAFESRARTKTDSLKQRQHSSQLDNEQHLESGEFQSLIERMATLGANPQLAKGADENLLLADYVTWNGPNTTLCQKQTPRGPDAGLICGERGYKAVGRNGELCKGPNKELSKGSIYARSKGANIKCN
ncbi:dual specificity protein kinase splA isoform X3 [Drosophila mojavensis]|uniref:Uncharacterized protein, isoform E n=1 Tax=Drosophila mojavensis TaxID=7230 RepID=A0A0Q9XLN6_DROMO|nr:dual specificity protein kinase splA isoform X3 [Drosophila mojavensis]KRG06082.1 uncharacterized protein Dmoj_GI13130, isoform E [Drosophila mojavensis]